MLLPAMFFLAPTVAAAQWTAEAGLGRAVYDPVSARIGAVNASLGLRYGRTGGPLGLSGHWFYLSGGTDLGSPGLLWGAGGLGGRVGLLRRGDWQAGVALGAHLYGYSESKYEVEEPGGPVRVEEPGDWGGTLEAIPTLAFRRGPLGVELRSGVVESFGPFEGEYLAVTAFDGGASVALTAAPGVEVGASGRYMHFPEGGYPHLGASLRLSRGRGAVWGFGGRWLSDRLEPPRSEYGIGGSLTARPGLEVAALWQQEASDPLYFNAPRRTWNLRMSRRFGRTPAAAGIVPPVPSAGGVAIRLPLAAADEPPSVLGDFTGWQPVPMARVGDFWEVRLPIPSGVHHYVFRNAQGVWFVPDHLPSTDDGMGGKSAVLVVQ